MTTKPYNTTAEPTAQECPFCKATANIEAAMKLLDEIEEMGEPFFDDPFTAAYNALDDAKPNWVCWGHGDKVTA